MFGTSTRLYNFDLSVVPWHSSGIAFATWVDVMRNHISGFVTSGVAMRHCSYLFCAVLRIYRVDVARQCDELCCYFHMQRCAMRRAFRDISSSLPAAIHIFVTTGSPTGTCAGFSTSRSTWYYCRIFRYVTIIFNGYGSRPYVILFTTSTTSSFVVVVLAALLPVVCASRNFTLCLSLVSTMLLTRWLRGLRPWCFYIFFLVVLCRNFVPEASCKYPCTIAQCPIRTFQYSTDCDSNKSNHGQNNTAIAGIK